MTIMRNTKPYRRTLSLASNEAILAASLIAGEVGAVQQSHVCSVAMQRHLDSTPAQLPTQVVARKLISTHIITLRHGS